jgi:MtN3 and saliva related transmembrane protein
VIEIVGILGAAFLGLCAVPQALKCWRTRSAVDISWAFLGLWLAGEILTSAYVIASHAADPVLLANYLLNTVLIILIIYIKSN